MAPKALLFCGMTLCSALYADSTDNNFTPDIPTVPGATSGAIGGANPFGLPPGEQQSPGAPGAPGANNGGSGFSQFLQQQTTNAMPTFKNVTYQHLSASENQNDFGTSGSDDSSPPTTFHVFEANS